MGAGGVLDLPAVDVVRVPPGHHLCCVCHHQVNSFLLLQVSQREFLLLLLLFLIPKFKAFLSLSPSGSAGILASGVGEMRLAVLSASLCSATDGSSVALLVICTVSGPSIVV